MTLLEKERFEIGGALHEPPTYDTTTIGSGAVAGVENLFPKSVFRTASQSPILLGIAAGIADLDEVHTLYLLYVDMDPLYYVSLR
jgi:hypothetical protein